MAKSQFLANVSHELRTPMNAILGMTELALREELPPTVRDYLKTAKDSADVLLVLLNGILDFSRMEAGKLQIEAVPFNLRQIVQQTLSTMGVPGEKGLKLICDLPDDVPDTLVGDFCGCARCLQICWTTPSSSPSMAKSQRVFAW